MIIEIKTRLDDLGALERQLGWYERMAWQAGATRSAGGRLGSVACVLALASDEVERVVRAHRDTHGDRLPSAGAEHRRRDPGSEERRSQDAASR